MALVLKKKPKHFFKSLLNLFRPTNGLEELRKILNSVLTSATEHAIKNQAALYLQLSTKQPVPEQQAKPHAFLELLKHGADANPKRFQIQVKLLIAMVIYHVARAQIVNFLDGLLSKKTFMIDSIHKEVNESYVGPSRAPGHLLVKDEPIYCTSGCQCKQPVLEAPKMQQLVAKYGILLFVGFKNTTLLSNECISIILSFDGPGKQFAKKINEIYSLASRAILSWRNKAIKVTAANANEIYQQAEQAYFSEIEIIGTIVFNSTN